jgi:hypothetical protein
MPAKVFISCGQCTAEEKETASAVKDWFETETQGFKAYVATEVLTGVSDLNRWVINELKSSDYFVFINFARGEASWRGKSVQRGSVYANQELAIAISLGFEDRMILVNQRGVEREGIFGFMISNPPEFSLLDEVIPIIEKSVQSAGWHHSSYRHLRCVEKPWIDPTAVDYGAVWQRRHLYIAHIKVRNSRRETPAPDCAMRLVRIKSSILGERESPDQNPLKVPTRPVYSQTIQAQKDAVFDLFGIHEEGFPNTYLLSDSDVPRPAILTTPEMHVLTYEITATGFPTVRAKVAVDLSGKGPPSNTGVTIYQPSGEPTTISVSVVGQSEISGSPPRIWDPTPKICIVEPGDPLLAASEVAGFPG